MVILAGKDMMIVSEEKHAMGAKEASAAVSGPGTKRRSCLDYLFFMRKKFMPKLLRYHTLQF